MVELFSRYESGIQFTAGVMTGSFMGVSGLNPLVDRLNSIAPNGSQVSGTNVSYYGTGTLSGTTAVFIGSIINSLLVSGTSLLVYASGVNNGTTSYASIHGAAFQSDTEIGDYSLNSNGYTSNAAIAWSNASIQIPNKAVVVGAIVYGSDATNAWTLSRSALAGGTTGDLGTAAVNTEDTSITNATIDNSTYSYTFQVTGQSTADVIYGARVTYTIGNSIS